MPRAAYLLLFAAALVVAGVLDGHAAKRVALVIGNTAYRHTPPLVNPANDAADMAAALERLGFEVIFEANLTKSGMDDTFRRFARAMRDADAALFFYAGHGMQFQGVNYLMPVDARLDDEADLPYEMAQVDNVLADMSRVNGVRIVVLDACRNNPLEESLKSKLARTRNIAPTRGFARVARTEGQLIAFATQTGTVAGDGTGRNSPFTTALLKHIETPGLEAGLLFRRVASVVHGATGGKQLPELSISLLGEFYFAGRGSADRPTVPGPKVPPAQAPISQAAQAWATIQTAKSTAVLEAFIRKFPQSVYADFAKARLAELNEQKVAVGVFPQKPKPGAGRGFTPGEAFRDCADCPEMVVVPAGSFTMGSPAGEKGREKFEGPQRRITISEPFAVGKFEITLDQFGDFVNDSGHRTGSKCMTNEAGEWKERSGRTFRKPGFRQARSEPVICVNWDDINAYVNWLSRKTGKAYRLLSEAEWEYAARAGTQSPYWWGTSASHQYANYGEDACCTGMASGRDRWVRMSPVGSFPANAFGLHDMHGNVFEWVEDCWHSDYSGDATDGSPRSRGDCSYRVLRGGCWNRGPKDLRSAVRFADKTGLRSINNGFRVARSR